MSKKIEEAQCEQRRGVGSPMTSRQQRIWVPAAIGAVMPFTAWLFGALAGVLFRVAGGNPILATLGVYWALVPAAGLDLESVVSGGGFSSGATWPVLLCLANAGIYTLLFLCWKTRGRFALVYRIGASVSYIGLVARSVYMAARSGW